MNQKFEIELHYNFVQGLKLIRNSASKLYNRPLLTTVSVSIKKGKVLIEATDSYKCISAEIADLQNEEINYTAACFSAEFIDFIIKEFKNQDGYMLIDTKNDLLTFRHGKDGLRFSTSRFPGNYPELSKLFGRKHQVEIKKKWYQEFSIVFDESGEDYAKATFAYEDGKPFDLTIPKDRFNPILRFFRGTKDVEMYHQGKSISVLVIDFNNMWKYTVILLPVRTI